MSDLLYRLQAADGPDREIDRAIHDFILPPAGPDDPNSYWYGGALRELVRRGQVQAAPDYTGSIDAALRLCEPNLSWSLWSTLEGGYAADCFAKFMDASEQPTGVARTAPIALCIAALKKRGAL